MEITSKKGKKIFVEVKTQSPLGKAQLKKYMNRGHVASLTPICPPILDEDDRFLGHFFWHDVYSIIRSAKPNTILHTQFLHYLKERHMGEIEPITKKELAAAALGAGFVRKSKALLECVLKEIKHDWEHEWGENRTGRKGVCDDRETGGVHTWWFAPKSWHKTGKGFYLSIGVGLEGEPRPRPCFYVGVGSYQGRFGRNLDADLQKQFDKLCKLGWKKVDAPGCEWGYYKYHRLNAGNIDKAAREHTGNVRQAVKELQRFRVVESMKQKI
jgi:hypothetical protein